MEAVPLVMAKFFDSIKLPPTSADGDQVKYSSQRQPHILHVLFHRSIEVRMFIGLVHTFTDSCIDMPEKGIFYSHIV